MSLTRIAIVNPARVFNDMQETKDLKQKMEADRKTITDRETLTKLFTEVGPNYADRPGGYTRIVKVGQRRGDGSEMAIIELV